MYNLKLLVLSLLVLTKSSRSFAPIPVREVTFKFPLTDHSSTFLRLKSDDLLEEDAKLSPAQQQRGLDDDVTTVVAESTKNYDNRKEEECAIPSYNDCDPEGGYKSLVEEIAESIDVARETARLDGLSAYIVVSGLTCASSLSVCLGFIGFSHTTLEATILDCITVLSASLSGITGIYSTVVFSLCVCYGRTAIGKNNDKGYDAFMRDTESYRSKAFRAYLASLCLFLFEIVLISSEQIPEPIRYPYLALLSIASIFLSRDCAEIVKQASPIFANITKVE